MTYKHIQYADWVHSEGGMTTTPCTLVNIHENTQSGMGKQDR